MTAKPKVLVLYNEPTLPPDHPDADSEYDILDTADAVVKHLQNAGLPAVRFGFVDNPRTLIDGLQTHQPDVVFNLYEGTATWGNSEAFVAGILELLRIPFTGSPVQALILARSKPLTKQLLAGADLATAPFLILEGDCAVPENTLGWPVIVKPGREDASIGIEQSSVCMTPDQLAKRVEYLRKTYGPTVLVEQFIRGREFHVPVWDRGNGPAVLPFTEIFFLDQNQPDALWPIVSFDAKWKPDSKDYKATPAVNPAVVDPALQAKVADLAIKAFELVGCRDYARMDFRIDETGEPYLLEVNPNPCISPLAGIAEALTSSTIPFAEFVLSLVWSALRRGAKPELADAQETAVDSPVEQASSSKLTGKIRTELETGLTIAIESQVVGWIGSIPHPIQSNIHLLSYLMVDPEVRRRGLATQLLAEREQQLQSQGIRLLLVELSSKANVATLRQFLTRRGFQPAGEVPDFYPDGASRLTYVKPLNPSPSLSSDA
ncbi:hypothetical protein BH11PLA2_BH11PLA2_00190 [soil metagenome]